MAKIATPEQKTETIQWGRDSKLEAIAQLEVEQAEQQKAIQAAQAKIAEAEATKKELQFAEQKQRLAELKQQLSPSAIDQRIAPVVASQVEARRAAAKGYHEYRRVLSDLLHLANEADTIENRITDRTANPGFQTAQNARFVDYLLGRLVRQAREVLDAEIKTHEHAAAVRFAFNTDSVAR